MWDLDHGICARVLVGLAPKEKIFLKDMAENHQRTMAKVQAIQVAEHAAFCALLLMKNCSWTLGACDMLSPSFD